MKVVEIVDKTLKKKITRDILLDLTDWFGLEKSRDEYIEKGLELPFWALYDKSEVLGFIYVEESSSDTLEIYCMGVKEKYHRTGGGRMLIDHVLAYARLRYKLLQVKTVAEGYYDQYDQTVAFYKAMGFYELEIFPSLWDAHNPCLILVQGI